MVDRSMVTTTHKAAESHATRSRERAVGGSMKTDLAELYSMTNRTHTTYSPSSQSRLLTCSPPPNKLASSPPLPPPPPPPPPPQPPSPATTSSRVSQDAATNVSCCIPDTHSHKVSALVYLLHKVKMMMMMMSFICSCRIQKEEPSSIYTLRKVRTIRGCLEGLPLMI